jgi:Peptidase M15
MHKPGRLLSGLILMLVRCDGSSMRASEPFDAGTAPFAITFQGETSAYREMSTFVLPGTALTFEAVGETPGGYTLAAHEGAVTALGARQWRWTAPGAFGVYRLVFEAASGKERITLNVFAMVPVSLIKDGYLNGYPIGDYPAKPLKGNPIYKPPAGFVEVTAKNQDMRVSPHFQLKQFICKEDTTASFPKYVVLKERLLLKLEAILGRVNELGFHVDTLHVLSGYRTPYYNQSIGDGPYSMHQFGGAADIYVDHADKGRMDDLNADGVIDIRDARFLYDEVEKMLGETPFRKLQGGMGFYPATSAHPPFVHVDVRGTRVRWQG